MLHCFEYVFTTILNYLYIVCEQFLLLN